MISKELAAKNIEANAVITIKKGRYYVHCREESAVESALSRLIGISGWVKTVICNKNMPEILDAAAEEGKKILKLGKRSFKIKAHRTDKGFFPDSYGIAAEAGKTVCETTGLKVDINNPDDIIYIEIREKAFIYSGLKKGIGGLPVGTAGRGLLLLSGGIDSPVAGFLMACRGMGIDAIHFHAYPYTSIEAKQKAITLSEILAGYCMEIKLYIINFTRVQLQIKERAPAGWATVLLRMAMMEAAEKAAYRIKGKCLISGESLSQVASQTIENISCIQSRIKLPVLRPLIGTDKDSIIRIAERIGTYGCPIEPFEDCCTLFSPEHPVIKGKVDEANRLYEGLALEPIIDQALADFELVKSF
jgi:thiamine biosynthesis protein ThiI